MENCSSNCRRGNSHDGGRTARGATVIKRQNKSFISRTGDEVADDKFYEELKTRSRRSVGCESSRASE